MEKRLDIGKCNERLNPGKVQREPTFQVILDALALTPCYSAFLISADVPEGQDFDALHTDEEIMSFLRDLGHTREIHSLNDVVVDQMHQPWRTFVALINRSLSGKTTGLNKLRFSRAQILWGMYHQKNVDYVELLWEDFIYQIDNKAYKKQEKIFVSAKEETQIYGAILPDSLTSPEMKETKAYKTYLISKKKEKVDVTRGKGIELLSKVALAEDAQFKEVRKKSMRDFHKTHPSGSGTVTKTAPSAVKIIPLVTSEGIGVKPGVPNVTEEESSESKAESWGNDEDDSNNEQESGGEDNDQKNDSFESDQDKNEEDKDDEEEVKDELVKTPSNDSDDEDETKFTNKAEVDYDKGFVQEEGTDVAMTNIQQGNENSEILQVIEDAHVTLSIVPQKIEVPVTSSSHSSDLAAKFLNFSDIPYTNAEIVSPMDVHVHHEVPSQQTPTLLTVPISIISDSSPVFSTVILQYLPSFTSPPQ
ncbi:hypothetical protein Tco_0091393 [Tanacetum coccineum]